VHLHCKIQPDKLALQEREQQYQLQQQHPPSKAGYAVAAQHCQPAFEIARLLAPAAAAALNRAESLSVY
jgi:hypothetical protein